MNKQSAMIKKRMLK